VSKKKRLRQTRDLPRDDHRPATHAAPIVDEFTPLDALVATLFGLAVLVIYTLTLCPTVPGGDSGELIGAATVMGVAHPPGYPLWTLLAKLFTYLPHGSTAWRVNFLSAVCDSAAAVLLFAAVRRWSGNTWAALTAAGLFAFSPLVWSYAVVAEVFPLNNLFVAALLYIVQRYASTRNTRYALAGAFTIGLALANHHTFIFVAAPFTLWVFWLGREELFEPTALVKMAGLFFLGLLPYLYLPIAASHYPAISWGHTQSVQGFLDHLLRREYGTLQLGTSENGSGGQLVRGVAEYARDTVRQLLGVGVLVAFVGALSQWRRERALGLTAITAIIVAFYVVVFHALANLPFDIAINREVTARFWQQPNLFLCAWIGLAVAALMRWIKTKSDSATVQRFAAPAFAFVLVGTQLGVHYKAQDQSDNRVVYQFGHGILDGLPPNSILLTSGDVHTNSTRYLQQGERVRPDVLILDRALLSANWTADYMAHAHPDVVMPGAYYRPGEPGGFTLEQFAKANAASKRPIFLTNFQLSEDRGWEKSYETWPWGITNWLVPKDTTVSVADYLARTNNILGAMRDLSTRTFADGTWERVVWSEYWEADHRKARRLLTYATSHGKDPADIRRSISLLDSLIARAPLPTAQMYRNLGAAWSTLLGADPAAPAGMVKAWKVYLATQPVDDAQIGAIRAAVAKWDTNPKTVINAVPK
jgi:hypothetical protein